MKHVLTRGAAGISFLILVIIALAFVPGCDTLTGADEDDAATPAAARRWFAVYDAAVEGPVGVAYRAILVTVEGTSITAVLYDETAEGVVQVSGFGGDFTLVAGVNEFEITRVWLGEDPSQTGVTWDGRDWYDVPADMPEADRPGEGAFAIDGDTFTIGPTGTENELTLITQSQPEALTGDWVMTGAPANTLGLTATSTTATAGWGDLTYTYDAQEGSGYWAAFTVGETSYFRQDYRRISDETDLGTWEHLTPYVVDAATGAVTLYSDFAETPAGAWSYTPAE
jgi:hypothetical protein